MQCVILIGCNYSFYVLTSPPQAKSDLKRSLFACGGHGTAHLSCFGKRGAQVCALCKPDERAYCARLTDGRNLTHPANESFFIYRGSVARCSIAIFIPTLVTKQKIHRSRVPTTFRTVYGKVMSGITVIY